MFKEFAQYLGAKIEFSQKEIVAAIRNNQLNPQKVELDLTSKAIEKLQDASQLDIQNILKTMKEVASSNSADMKGLSQEVAKLVKAVESESSETHLLKTHSNLLRQILNVAEKMQKTMDSSSDAKEMAKLDAIIKAVKDNKPEKVNIDVSELKVISAELKTLNRTTKEKGSSKIEEKLDKVIAGLETLASKKYDFPKTLKLDDMQVRRMSSGSGGAGVQTRGATKKTIGNVALTATNTEYSYTFPANTISFTMKIRGQAALLYYAFESGKLPSSGDGSAYATLGQNFLQLQDNVEWSNQTIYLGSDTASQVAEIISYQL